MTSGRTFDIRHPEMVKVGKTHLIVFSVRGDQPEAFYDFQTVVLMLTEYASHLEAVVSA